MDETKFDKRERNQEPAAEFTERRRPLGWFEASYAESNATDIYPN